MDFFGKTIDGSRSLYLDELTVTWNADILATSLFSKPSVFDTTLKITETLTLGDTNSVTLSPNFITTPYTLFLPPTQGSSSTFLENNGSGVLTWRSSLTLPYVTSVALTTPSFLTVTGSPITSAGTLSITYSGTPLPVLNGGTGVTTSTGTGNNVLSNNAYLTGADLTNTFLDGTLTLASPLSILNGGTGVTTSTGSGNNVLSNNADLIGADLTDTFLDGTLTLDTPLSTANGGTGLNTLGLSGQILVSNGSNMSWEYPELIGIMRYKQTFYPYFYITPPQGMQLWPEFSNIDFRTLYPVLGGNAGISLTYNSGDTGFGRFYNNNSFTVIAEVSYSVSRYLPLALLVDGINLDSYLAVVAIGLNGSTLTWIEKNNNGDRVGQSGAPSGGIMSSSFSLILEPGDFFQLRSYNNSPTVSLINVESEVTIDLKSLGVSTSYAPQAPGTGTVTSVNISTPNSFFSVGGGPITTSGTLSIGLSGTALPTLSGGTGLTAVGTNGQVLTSNGSTLTWQTPSAPGTGTVTSVSATTPAFLAVSGSPITASGTLALTYSGTALPTLNGGTGLTAVGANGQVLTSNGATLTWQTPSAPGTGTVTSVSASVPSFLSVSGSPITASGTLALSYSGTALPILNGGTGLTAVGLNGQVLATNGVSMVWQTRANGSVTSVAATVPSFLTVTGSPITVSGTLAISYSGTALPTLNGGTGLTAVGANGQVLTSNGSTLTWQTPSAPGTGTVTSVSATTPAFLAVSGSPITTSGTLDLTYSGTALPTLNGGTGLTTVGTNGQVLRSNGTALAWATPTTGTVTSVAATVPSFLSVTGSPITASGTLAISYSGTALPTANGGTGLTTVGTNGQVLRSNGTVLAWATPTAGTVTSVSATVPSFLTVTGSPITASGTLALAYSGTALPVLNGGTGVTTSTGSVNNVLSTSPTFQNQITIASTTTNRTIVLDNTGTASCQIVMPNAAAVLFSNTAVNDLVIYCERGKVYIASDDTNGTGVQVGRSSKPTSIQGSTLSIGPNLYPTVQGINNQVLTTNGSGTLSWTTQSGTGTVTSVSASVPSFLSVSGSPITTSGTLALTYSGTALPVLNGGTGVTTSTGTLNNVLSTSPTFQNQIIISSTTTNRSIGFDSPGIASCQITMVNAAAFLFSNTAVNDLLLYSERGKVYIASDDTNGTGVQVGRSAKVTSIQGSTIALGSTFSMSGTGGDALFTSALTVNGGLRTPQITGSGDSGDLAINSTRNVAITTSGNTFVNANNISLTSPNIMFANSKRIDNTYGYADYFLPQIGVNNNSVTELTIQAASKTRGFTLNHSTFSIKNTTGQGIIVQANFQVQFSLAGSVFGTIQAWIQTTQDIARRYGFKVVQTNESIVSTCIFTLDVNESFSLYTYQSSGNPQPINGIDFNTQGIVPTYLFLSFAGI